ncbi:trifunctional transcriptional activator/DNA repair protein Ada/methylated-DNA--[protein]-cysteine S-methyltransferase [Rhodobacteraceae bacterium M382]|nr:trifunctional transcriptional activator/DNA repair protein Ada/methylated-DNA--[protein]-cysteine S-methyltransferase [Rhodobacteraceae bacterium M382]
MLFDLPDPQTLYSALVARDPAYDGVAYVGVTSTGIFCRLSCPARHPKPENCRFYATPSECIESGFRPCKRCHPLAPMAQKDPIVARLLDALDKSPAYRWSEQDIVRLGLDLSTVRRVFKRHFGMTFLDMARHRRLREGFTTLGEGGRVVDAQVTAGFESPSAFRAAFARLLGRAPSAFSATALLKADWIETPLGAMIGVSCTHRLHLLEFIDRKALPRELSKLEKAVPGGVGLGRLGPTDQIASELASYFSGNAARFVTPVQLHGTAFEREVWRALMQIPAGETRSYSQLAHDIGRPTATRAVARANGVNQLAIIVPCHRVLGADGALTGYGGGVWRKQRMIEIESGFAAARRS